MAFGKRTEKLRARREEIKERLYRRRYLVPNAVTVGAMFCGFLSIIYAASGRFEKASIAIFFAILLDGLDGRVARRLNATSRFGIEFDSLSDAISFGVAPALLMYHWCFRIPADEFGVLVSFVYASCAASRLARFNIMQENLKSFLGLPSPAAAAVLAALVNLHPVAENSYLLVACYSMVTLIVGFLMVSRIEYLSIKQVKLVGVRRLVQISIAALFGLIWYNHRVGLLVLALGYAMSGPISAIFRKGQSAKVAAKQQQDNITSNQN